MVFNIESSSCSFPMEEQYKGLSNPTHKLGQNSAKCMKMYERTCLPSSIELVHECRMQFQENHLHASAHPQTLVLSPRR